MVNPLDHLVFLITVYSKLKSDITYKLNVTKLGNCLVLLLFMTSYAKQCLVPIVLIQEETNLFCVICICLMLVSERLLVLLKITAVFKVEF